MKKTLCVLATASAFAATAAIAGGPGPMAPPAPMSVAGVYINANAGYGSWGINAPSDVDHSGFMFGANLGYQFNEYFAVEAGYMYLPEVKGTTTIFGNTFNVQIDNYAIVAALKAMYPFTPEWSIFAKLGTAYTHGSVSVNGSGSLADQSQWNFYAAAGVEYSFNPNVSVNVQAVVIPTGNDYLETYWGGMAGVTYKFLM